MFVENDVAVLGAEQGLRRRRYGRERLLIVLCREE